MGKFVVTKDDDPQLNIQRIHEELEQQLQWIKDRRLKGVVLTYEDAKSLKEFLDDFAYG